MRVYVLCRPPLGPGLMMRARLSSTGKQKKKERRFKKEAKTSEARPRHSFALAVVSLFVVYQVYIYMQSAVACGVLADA